MWRTGKVHHKPFCKQTRDSVSSNPPVTTCQSACNIHIQLATGVYKVTIYHPLLLQQLISKQSHQRLFCFVSYKRLNSAGNLATLSAKIIFSYIVWSPTSIRIFSLPLFSHMNFLFPLKLKKTVWRNVSQLCFMICSLLSY